MPIDHAPTIPATARRLPSTSGPRHAIAAILASGYGLFLALVVFWPSPIDRPFAALLARLIAEAHERGVPSFVDYAFIEFTANVALFIPVGVVLGLIVPLRWTILALLLGPALSGAIELAQHVLLPGRYSSGADIVANSWGAAVGVILAVTVRAIVALRDEKVIARHEALSDRDAA
ncbi:VanZ family protein [Microbacterium sp. Sa4CUA7]|uniref:VanZ family protein n=1 Tax=Microbacterium pullorum TaxID=2762236 RepID=A0ABR8S471_9MICO|nr:VanZ family protein [Microbacterium pullorum]MBD7958268.1 VanZ family protein [Microbacterium pullorum]